MKDFSRRNRNAPVTLEYLKSRCKVVDGCWIWQGAKTRGYACIGIGKIYYAHIIAYELAGNPAPPPKHELHHKCQQRACINPEHLELLSSTEHRRISIEARGLKSACKHGHPYTEGSFYTSYASGYLQRRCKICQREAISRSRQRS